MPQKSNQRDQPSQASPMPQNEDDELEATEDEDFEDDELEEDDEVGEDEDVDEA